MNPQILGAVLDQPAHLDQARQWTERFQQAVTGLTAETVSTLSACYHPNARFSDPFQTIEGRHSIEAAYRAMFQSLSRPRFENLEIVWAGPHRLVVGWQFVFQWKPSRPETRIGGSSWLRLCPETGLILDHEDHWDASELFAAVPALTWIMRTLKSRVAKSAHVTEIS